jgi:orotate phosphoribosyltransferase
MSVLRADLAKLFIESKSFKYDPVNKFTLSSGELSPFYVDCKSLMGLPGARRLVAELVYERILQLDLEFDSIGGLEIGSIAMATSISDYGYLAHPKRCWETFVVRKKPKEHGLRNKIEGKIGKRALIVDDVLTTGGSILDAVEVAREANIKITHALVIVDRDEKNGRNNLLDQEVNLVSLLTIRDLVEANTSLEPALR